MLLEGNVIMKRKYLALFLAAAIAATTLAGCSGKDTGGDKDSSVAGTGSNDAGGTTAKTADELLVEKYAEPVKVHIPLGYKNSENPDTPDSVTPETQTAIKMLKEELNIEIIYDWIVNTDQYEAKFGAELAAGNIPDIMFLSPTQFEDLQSQGALGDLTETWEKYGAGSQKVTSIVNFDGKILDTGKKDGKLYGLSSGGDPTISIFQMWYNKAKLAEVGVTKLPETISEFEALCDKLLTLDIDGNGKTGDPVIPAGKEYFNGGLTDLTTVFHAYGASPSGWFDKNGEMLESGATDKALIEPLTKLNEWYKKGYFAKDFAAQDVWAADAPIVNDIIAGKYAIVPGSWWVSNWPLNDNFKNDPTADWVVGPALKKDGETKPTFVVNKYMVNGYHCASKDFKNPEVILKIINSMYNYGAKIANPEYVKNRTPEQKLENDSYVYHWLPVRSFVPTEFADNYKIINKAIADGKTELDPNVVPNSSELWNGWNSYQAFKANPKDAKAWGFYASRVAPEGGVGRAIADMEIANKVYNEVYTTTPTMIKKQGELDKFRNTTMLSMIMGETPISDFDKYVVQWNKLGGTEIQKEVSEWYNNK